jgi:cobalamin biosynthesis protein CbiD
MANILLDLDRLRVTLRARGVEEDTVSALVSKAQYEIESEMQANMSAAMDMAIQSGVQKQSADFINELRPMPGAFQLETSSSNTDFSEPPYPMLDNLLKQAKPMIDGSGVYKVIPVGTPGKKATIANNIFDAQKQIAAERYESATAQYNKTKPSGSKANFRTATSKQSRSTSWVMPAKDKDFTSDITDINSLLDEQSQEIIERVIRSYEENF